MSQSKPILAILSLVLLSACNSSGGPSTTNTANMSDITIQNQTVVLAYCPEVQRRLSQDDCDDLHQALVRAKEGVAAFNVPDQLMRGRPTTIQLAIAFDIPGRGSSAQVPNDADMMDANVSDNAADPESGNASADVEPTRPSPTPMPTPTPTPQTPIDVVKNLPGTPVSYAPIVGKDMRAELLGEGFKIEALTDADQQVGDIGVTTWEWKVTALEKGPHTLTLKTMVRGITADGKKYTLIPTIRNQTVNVNLSWGQQVYDFIFGLPAWLQVITAALTATTTLLGAYFGLRLALKKRGSGGDTK